MELEEFSSGFDTLLNSFANTASFGKDTSIQDIRIDEYEKSVFLTKSEYDITLELYSGRNSFGASFEENEELRRSLAKLVMTSELFPVEGQAPAEGKIDGIIHYGSANGWINAPFSFKTYSTVPVRVLVRSIEDTQYTLREDLIEHHSPVVTESSELITIQYDIPCNITLNRYLGAIGELENVKQYAAITWPRETSEMYDQRYNGNIGESFPAVMYDVRAQFIPIRTNLTDKSYCFNLPNLLWRIVYEAAMLNTPSGVICAEASSNIGQGIRIVPVTHDELATVLRNPFRGPKADRILRLDKSENQVELISVKHPVSKYIVRYIRKPAPIILIDLEDGLEIEGETKATPCELHESLHRKILERAVLYALQSKGISMRGNKE